MSFAQLSEVTHQVDIFGKRKNGRMRHRTPPPRQGVPVAVPPFEFQSMSRLMQINEFVRNAAKRLMKIKLAPAMAMSKYRRHDITWNRETQFYSRKLTKVRQRSSKPAECSFLRTDVVPREQSISSNTPHRIKIKACHNTEHKTVSLSNRTGISTRCLTFKTKQDEPSFTSWTTRPSSNQIRRNSATFIKASD